MNRTYVALDLETTGLDPQRDTILEVGAVRFRTSFDNGSIQARVLDTLSTLINPDRPIPIQVQQLTGISQEQVAHQPRFSQVIDNLARFVGQDPVIGHNVAFDVGFLRSHDLPLNNLAIDTFEMAGILLPHADRYSLSKLGEMMGLETLGSHRALDDAQAAKDLFVALLIHASELPTAVLQEINRISGNVGWSLKGVFRDVERGLTRTSFRGGIGQQLAAQLEAREDALGPLFSTDQVDQDELVPTDPAQPVDVDELAAMLGEDGLLAQSFPLFEYRPQQVEMLHAVAEALNHQQHVMVEAGTGTGKSIAYLLPAAAFAHLNGQRIVISTNTINLQDQLFQKDVPDLQELLPFEFRAALLKGRSNYVCQRRLETMRKVGATSTDELRMLAKVLVWLPSTQTGERGELFMPSPLEQALWGKLSAESDTCTNERCSFRERGRCFFYRARRSAEQAHLIIVNHALLLSDVAVDNRVLPEYHYLIVDEAHHLEGSVTRQLSFSAEQRTLERILNELVRSRGGAGSAGFLSDVLAQCKGSLPPQDWVALEGHIRKLQRKVETSSVGVRAFFSVLDAFLREHSPQKGAYDQRLRLTSGLRIQPAWSDLEIAWDDMYALLLPVIEGLETLCSGLGELDGYGIRNLEGMSQDCIGYFSNLGDIAGQINACIAEPSQDDIYWASISSRDERVVLHAAPLHVGTLVEKHLFHAKESVILTSATLTTNGSFDYIRERLDAWDADELSVGSPFDFESSTLLYLPDDIPEPNQPYYQKSVEQALLALCRATEGRTLALFTSYHQLRTTARALNQPLSNSGIVTFQQGAGTSRAQLLENFRTTPKSVLMGTRSFWEGVDVSGPALSVLVLARLPFAVPSDPIFAARSDTFEDPFGEYTVPEAILRFRQGFGRLIRSKTDRGVVVILDRRLQTKAYGPLFLNSLPNCTSMRASVARLPQEAKQWLDKG